MNLRAVIVLAAFLILGGCGALKSQEVALERIGPGKDVAELQGQGPALHATIPAPTVPGDLKARAAAEPRNHSDNGPKHSYTIDCQSPKIPELCEKFEQVSRLAMMRAIPATLTTLEQRLTTSLEEGQKILWNFGYYDGRATGRLISEGSDKAKAVVSFNPGTQYKLGASLIIVSGRLAEDNEAKATPETLADVGLKPGVPARTDDILAAAGRVEDSFRNQGYPRAVIEASRYTIDRAQKTLYAELQVTPNGFARMGQIVAAEGATVDQKYLEAMRPWKIGQPWNQELADNYLASLRQTGLFQSVEGFPADEDDRDGLRPMQIRLVGAPERTVGGLVSYDTDLGPGITGYWEHRNLTGHGDRLRVDMPLWSDMQELTATYRYPYFLRPDQDIIAQGGLLHEDTDAYRLTSGMAAAGLERRLSRWWRVSVMGSVEGGSLKDPGQDKKEFMMFGLPVTASYDTTNSLLDPTRGVRVMMLASPYTGTFHNDFNVVRTRLESHGFIPLGSDRLVMALRGVWGSLWGADNSQEVPSSLRFYSGGGGSVRGYDYQSVGPRNEKNDPLGGVSQVEVGAETRWRFNETMGLVAFVDGGMVYENVDDKLFQDLLWGAGLGFRYYTAIGPVRLDVAAPLNRRSDDDAWQMYISIGQSF